MTRVETIIPANKHAEPILSIRNLSKVFPLQSGFWDGVIGRMTGLEPKAVHAVDNVSLDVRAGETIGIVGESGCGKSTLARILAGISQANGGQFLYRGRDIQDYLKNPRDALKIQMIFQDPQSSLNPRLQVIDIVGEAPVVHGIIPRSQKKDYVLGYLEKVGLGAEFLYRYPHQFSGGQRQRIGIARALAVNPELLICDESVAALDVSVQAQIINLFMKIKAEFGLTMLFISHDLGVIRHLCDRVVVMYLGRVVEVAPTERLFSDPRHPYTQMLLEGMPKISLERRKFLSIEGEIPSPINPPQGCHFHPRCAFRTEHCSQKRPDLVSLEEGRHIACLNWQGTSPPPIKSGGGYAQSENA
ncbi:ABC transporter ATP-binding protein [Telmatospirillum sp. J64-1]|uniref:ABC transporter ATP-binding protein n=1 Tax=Telmatospirillum sp. J64-1 TaxID=2502183 RepID=UPI00115EF17A|nr:ABC transporter ATP-binding protein [Telmatospirillum sp. J64-1]